MACKKSIQIEHKCESLIAILCQLKKLHYFLEERSFYGLLAWLYTLVYSKS